MSSGNARVAVYKCGQNVESSKALDITLLFFFFFFFFFFILLSFFNNEDKKEKSTTTVSVTRNFVIVN